MKKIFLLSGLLFLGVSPSLATDFSNVHICTELFADGAARPPHTQGVDEPACLWQKKTLVVRFLGGDPVVEDKVAYYARQWTPYSGISFVFTNSGDADIRVAFIQGAGSWSYVGACQGDLPQSSPTLNLGWLTPTTEDQEYSRVVLHEFGHALGLCHEHQNPAASIPWDVPKVYEYYRQTQHWDDAKIKANILDKYDGPEFNHGSYDSNSIMEYPIPKELTVNGFEVGWNTQLSPEDKRYMMQMYGVSAPVGEGNLAPAAAVQSDAAGKPAVEDSGLEAGWSTVSHPPELGLPPSPGAPADIETESQITAPAAVSPPPATAAAVPPGTALADEPMGRLESYIRHNESVRKAEQLKNDPRFNALAADQRGDFLNEYMNLMFAKSVPSRDSLIERTHQLDQANTEMLDRATNLRYDMASYESDKALLEARMTQYSQAVAAYNQDLAEYSNEVADHNNRNTDYSGRLAMYQSAVAAHNEEVAQYNSQCLGGPLQPGPYAQCVAWQRTLNQRMESLNGSKASLDDEGARLSQEANDLNNRRAGLQERFNDLNTTRSQFDQECDAMNKRNADLKAEKQKIDDWTKSNKDQWAFEINYINQWLALVDKFNARLEAALDKVNTH